MQAWYDDRGDSMKITDREMLIKCPLSVTKGRIRMDTGGQSCRHSDAFVYILSGEAHYEFAEKSISDEKADESEVSKGE